MHICINYIFCYIKVKMHLYMYTCVHSFFPYEQSVCFMIAISLYCVCIVTEEGVDCVTDAKHFIDTISKMEDRMKEFSNSMKLVSKTYA